MTLSRMSRWTPNAPATPWMLLLAALAVSAGCAETAAPGPGDGATPSVEDDLIPGTPGGKFDTGYLSTLAAELEGHFSATLRVDVREMSQAEREAELARLGEGGRALQDRVDRQLKYAKNQVNASALHMILSSSNVILVDSSLDADGFIQLSYETTVESIVTEDELKEAGLTLEAVLDQTYQAIIPDLPDQMASDVGTACLEEGHDDAEAYNYFYYYAPNRDGCAEAMAAAGVGRVTAQLEVRNLAANKTVFPEYDQLTADGRVDVVVFFGAADHDWEPGDWDWGTYGRDGFVRDLTNRGFSLASSDEGDLYTRTVGDLVENVRVIGPETLKLLRDDRDGLFRRHVSANEIVFYNGHSFYGSLGVLDDPELYPGRYQIFFMNSCWSYEYYTKQIFRHNATESDADGWLLADVVNDTETGWFHNMGEESRILLTNLLAGAESGGVDGTRFYTWDRIIGAMNQHAVDSQATRATETHEVYGVSGVLTNRYDPTTPEGPSSGTRFESTRRVDIPDDNADGASDSLTVTGVETVGSVTVRVEIEHTYIGDLTVTLHHGDRYFTLHDRAGGSEDDLTLERTTDHFEGLSGSGDWTLRVVDSYAQDVGAIVSWSIEL